MALWSLSSAMQNYSLVYTSNKKMYFLLEICRFCRLSDGFPHLLSIRSWTGDNKHQNHLRID